MALALLHETCGCSLTLSQCLLSCSSWNVASCCWYRRPWLARAMYMCVHVHVCVGLLELACNGEGGFSIGFHFSFTHLTNAQHCQHQPIIYWRSVMMIHRHHLVVAVLIWIPTGSQPNIGSIQFMWLFVIEVTA